MPRRRQSVSPQTNFGVLAERVAKLHGLYTILSQTKMSNLTVFDILHYNEPSEGICGLDWPTGKFCWYHDGEWICTPDSLSHAIKVYSDTKKNKTGDGVFRFSIDPKLDGKDLIFAGGFNGTAGGGTTLAQISNRTRSVDMLTTRITIASGSYDDMTTAVINTGGPVLNPFNRVHLHDRIWIDLDAAPVDSKGFGVFLYFDIPRVEANDLV